MRARPLLMAALLVSSCGRVERDASAGAAGTIPSSGPDPIVVRLPRGGGMARAYRYPALDDAIWRAQAPSPALDRLLAFDGENGVLAFLGRDGRPGWLDLRLGTARPASMALGAVASADGWSIFGADSAGTLARLTPSGDWTRRLPGAVRRVYPLPDGAVLALVARPDGGRLFLLRPPDDTIEDSVAVATPTRAATTVMGDRVYLASGRVLQGVRPRELAALEQLRAGADLLAVAPTPSGDRVFLANAGSDRLEVLDRYAGDIGSSVRLPGRVTDLRMDPLGRFLLARPVAGDSAWVVAVGADAFVGTVRTAWRPDLPTVAVDGLVATVVGNDVAFVEASTGAARRRAIGGAADAWFLASWNGLRPRARGLDAPVSFDLGGDSMPADSLAADSAVSVPPDPPRGDTVPAAPPAPEAQGLPARQSGWFVSFAALLREDVAVRRAEAIVVDGVRAQVVRTVSAERPIYRVVLGPFATREEARRVGQGARVPFELLDGIP